jgi:two-component system, NtrC family, response regulator AtoC
LGTKSGLSSTAAKETDGKSSCNLKKQNTLDELSTIRARVSLGIGYASSQHSNMSTSQSRVAGHPAIAAFVCGHSPAIQRLNTLVGEIAGTDIPVLLMGESGSGKEVYGRLIHRLSKSGRTPLKKMSCRTLEPGAFLPQLQFDLRGNGEGAEAGLRTLFLDGIDELDLACQKVLLSLLPDGEIEENCPHRVRLIASTSRNMEKEVESGTFRRELYFRINGVCLHLPPLRDRKEDIPELLEHFLAKHAAELGRAAPILSEKELEHLGMHDWPGNVRELENFARKIAVLGDIRKTLDELRETPKLDPAFTDESKNFSLKVAARAASRRAERDLISKALERTHWNRKRAARELQISYKSLLYKIKQTGLEGTQGETGVKEQ